MLTEQQEKEIDESMTPVRVSRYVSRVMYALAIYAFFKNPLISGMIFFFTTLFLNEPAALSDETQKAVNTHLKGK